MQSDVERHPHDLSPQRTLQRRVEPKIIQLEQGRVDLVFEINEGDVTGIKRISFVGNEHFSDGTLRGRIKHHRERLVALPVVGRPLTIPTG